jgi:hypothetical protein
VNPSDVERFVDALNIGMKLQDVSIFENFWNQVELYEQLKEHNNMQKEFINIASIGLRLLLNPF